MKAQTQITTTMNKEQWLHNVKLVEDKLSPATVSWLEMLADTDDDIRKMALSQLLDDVYIQPLDWLYSTLDGQSEEKVFELSDEEKLKSYHLCWN